VNRVRTTSLLADWVSAAEVGSSTDGEPYAQALLRACEHLSDEVLRQLPATPDEAAAILVEMPFAGSVDGVLLPWAWFEPFCTAQDLSIAELPDGWDIGDGEDVYWCPRVTLADEADVPDDTHAYVRVDQVRRWQ
jgi:hypothetical protein